MRRARRLHRPGRRSYRRFRRVADAHRRDHRAADRAFAQDADYFRLNSLILRNTSVINFLDCCAITLPIQPAGTAPVGLMVVGEHGADRRLLAIARGVEAMLDARR
jgi:Asp-tRNA(Asn)/Glu-tRNA(Gln) amidotransferase A subunit family amidase